MEIVFSALYRTISELGAKASALQKRSVTSHMIEIVRSVAMFLFVLVLVL